MATASSHRLGYLAGRSAALAQFVRAYWCLTHGGATSADMPADGTCKLIDTAPELYFLIDGTTEEVPIDLEEVLWCWTHSDARIYGQRAGRGTLYCRTYYANGARTDCNIHPRGMEREPRE